MPFQSSRVNASAILSDKPAAAAVHKILVWPLDLIRYQVKQSLAKNHQPIN